MPYLVAMLVAASSMLGVQRPERSRLDVVLDVDGDVALTRADLMAVARELTDIWAPHIDLHVAASDSDTRPHVRDAVRVVVSASTLRGHDSGGLGWIDFVDGAPLSTATVSLTALQRLISAGEWNHRPLAVLAPRASQLALRHGLARAAAHEVGHYLLRSTSHTRTGLMRARFTVDDLMDERPGAMRLESGQVARLQQQTLLLARRETDQAPVDSMLETGR